VPLRQFNKDRCREFRLWRFGNERISLRGKRATEKFTTEDTEKTNTQRDEIEGPAVSNHSLVFSVASVVMSLMTCACVTQTASL